MKTILCPTDFSTNAGNATEYACAFAAKLNARIILFHAYESPAAYTENEIAISHDVEKMLKEKVSAKLEALAKKLGKKYSGVTFETQYANGTGADETISAANRNDADMIIMGTTGTSKLERLLMGSTTSKVLANAECPVLCVPGDAEFMDIRKIVFATDLNEDNISSAMTIAPFAMQFGAEIIFVFVDDKHLIHSDEEINKMTRKIRTHVSYPKIAGYISKNTSVTKGIEYFLKKYPADILVMFTHHKHFPETLFNQSLTRIMSHQTNIPLLALKVSDRPVI